MTERLTDKQLVAIEHHAARCVVHSLPAATVLALIAEVRACRAELAHMRVVVEAACTYLYREGPPSGPVVAAFVNAVDAYSAGKEPK